MRGSPWSLGAALLALTGALVLVVLLTVQKRELEERYRQIVERATSAQPSLRLPWVSVTTLDGDTVTLGNPVPGRPQVLLFYTTTCPHCLATVPIWNAIEASARNAHVIGIQFDSGAAEAYRAKHKLRYEIVVADSALARRLVSWYRVRTVPLTLVVGEDGRVVYSRFGEIKDKLVVDSVVAALEAAVISDLLAGPAGAHISQEVSDDPDAEAVAGWCVLGSCGAGPGVWDDRSSVRRGRSV